MRRMTSCLCGLLACFMGIAGYAEEQPGAPDAGPFLREWSFPVESSGSTHLLGITDGPIQTVVIQTDADFGRVWDFYAEKAGSQDRFDRSRAVIDHKRTKTGQYFIRDKVKADGSRQSCIVFNCKKFTSTVSFQSLATGTHIDVSMVAHQ